MDRRAACRAVGTFAFLAALPLDAEEKDFTTETVRGRVVWMAEAAERLYGIKSVAEAKERTLAIETTDGKLFPLLEDVRGRAFRVDPRLRAMNVELVVRRYSQTPLLRVLGVYSLEKNGKFEIDYWCEICAIAMYELKQCECCQADIELRRRPVAEKNSRSEKK